MATKTTHRPSVIALVILLIGIICSPMLTGCEREATKVSRELSYNADSFDRQRRITVINLRDNTILFQETGLISVQDDNNDLDIIYKKANGEYGKNFFAKSEWITYIVEDLSDSGIDSGTHEISLLPGNRRTISGINDSERIEGTPLPKTSMPLTDDDDDDVPISSQGDNTDQGEDASN